jgi:hypothetical protein
MWEQVYCGVQVPGPEAESTQFRCRRLGEVLLVAIIMSGCAHHPNPSADLTSKLAPFTTTRNQAVHLVAATKHSLGPQDLNTLAVTYTALEKKANAYASFMGDSVRSQSFDVDRNNVCASQLMAAINAFNKTFPTIAAAKDVRTIPVDWVPTFADAMRTRWSTYNAAISTMSPDAKAALLKQLSTETVWPNYEDIATEPILTRPTPTP